MEAGDYKIYVHRGDLMCQLSQKQEEVNTKNFSAIEFAQEIECRDAVIFTVDSHVANLACFFAQILLYKYTNTSAAGHGWKIIDDILPIQEMENLPTLELEL